MYFLAICYAALVWLIAQAAYQVILYRWFSPLAKFPGPFLASCTRLWLAYHCLMGTESEVQWRLHQKHGPIIRISPTMLAVSEAARLQEVYHRRAKKTGTYLAGSLGTTENVFNTLSYEDHNKRRAIVSDAYSFSKVRRMESLLDNKLSQWTEQLNEKFVVTNKLCDFSQWAAFLTFDTMSHLAFSRPLGFIETGTDVDNLIASFRIGLFFFGLMSRLYPFTEKVRSVALARRFLVPTSADKGGIGHIMHIRDGLLRQRVGDLAKPDHKEYIDMVQRLLDAEASDGSKLNMDEVKAESLAILLAGGDTTSASLCTALHYILSYPEVKKKVMLELLAAQSAEHFGAVPQYAQLQEHCPYLTALVREAFRVCPSTPQLFPRAAPKGGATYYGRYVPEDTEISCTPLVIHRDPEIYGDDALEFKPERWLESEEMTRHYLRHDLGFGRNARTCLGKDLAFMEIHKCLAHLLLSFELSVAPGKRVGKDSIRGGVRFWTDMNITLTKPQPRPATHAQ